MSTELATLAVKAVAIQQGDVIDGRTVRLVTGRKPRSCTTRNSSNGSKGHLPNLTFTSNVVAIHFTDGNAPLYCWPKQELEVVRP